MKPFPHHYRVEAAAGSEGPVSLAAAGLPTLESDVPEEFGGRGGRWSPETLLVAAVADCFVLTFRAVARASGLAWTALRAEASGTLEKGEGGPRFTAVAVEAALTIPDGGSEEKARRLLEKAERACLVTRSLAAESQLVATVRAER